MARAGSRQVRSQGPVSVYAHIEGVTRCKWFEGRNDDGNGGDNDFEDGNEDRNGDVDRDGGGTGTGMEAKRQMQDRKVDGSGDRARTGTGAQTRGRTLNKNRSGNGDGIEDGLGNKSGEGRGGRGKLWYPHPEGRQSRRPGPTIPHAVYPL